MKFCIQDISKRIIARSFKLGQLKEDNEWITWLNLRKMLLFFLEILLFANLDIENL